MRGKWFVAIASVVLLALIGAAVTILSRAPAKKTQAAPPPQATAPSGEINLPGKIRPQQVTFVAAPIEGVVSAFFVEVGQEVFEGQLLARIANEGLETGQQDAQKELEKIQARVNSIESDVITARLEASRAQADSSRARGEYDRLEKIYRRQQMLYNEGATPKLVYEKSERDFETAQSEFRNLEAVAKNTEDRVGDIVRRLDLEKRTLEEKTSDLDSAKAKNGAAEVVSPVQGMVVARNGDVGLPVTPDKGDFFQIATQLSELEVVLDPDPPTLLRIKPGQPALVVLAELGGDGMAGAVKTIQGNQAVVAFTSPNAAVKPGMMAQVHIKVN
jgi:multidrug efflux pump subunit AcrA (membrane-fusion protein)